jgi:signal transduction histidine kinase
MGSTELKALGHVVGAHLKANADAIVDRWVEWVTGRLGTRTIASLPRQALLNHIPPVVRSLANYVHTPVQAVRSEMLGHLGLHARIRRSQGYTMQELLAEFDGLARIITAELLGAIDALEDQPSAADSVRVFARVSDGLRAIGFASVDLYRENEADHRERMAEQLEEFGRAIAHELRAPLSTASLAAELLADHQISLDPEQRERHIKIIKKALRRSSDLLDDVRMLAAAERGLGSFRYARLAAVVHDILEELTVSASQRGVVIKVPGELPEFDVPVVPTQLALANTISNSIKYADLDKDEPCVVISARMCKDQGNADRCEISVQDNGLGISPEYVAHAFERQLRFHPEVAEGTGLGLSITRQVLLDSHGTIELESQDGQGTTVRINVPATDARAPRPRGDHRSPYDLVKDAVESVVNHDYESDDDDDEDEDEDDS